MAKTKISEFSSTPGNNTDIDGINIAEGCAPSGINDAIRELMSQLKDFQAGTAGDSFNGPVGTTTAAAGAFTTLSASSTVTFSGGTANGVLYLNGSKVATSGSALTIDGTTFGLTVTGANPVWSINRSGATTAGVFSVENGNSAIFLSSSTTKPLAFYLNGSEQMRLDTTGLGIGTSSPATKLEVSGSAAVARVSGTAGTVPQLQLSSSGVVNWSLRSNNDSASDFTIYQDSTQRLKIDSSGNLGLGVTPSAWGANFTAIQLKNGSAIWNPYSGIGTIVGANTYQDGVSYKYIGTESYATMYRQINGTHGWHTAGAGTAGNAISFTQAMTLDASGNLGLGETIPANYGKFIVSASGATNPQVSINSTSGAALLNYYENGTGRFSLRTLNGSAGLSFYDTFNGTERARIDSSGNFMVGKTSAVNKIETVGAGVDGNAVVNGVGTTATTIYTIKQSATGALAVVFGDDGSSGFMDLVFFLSATTPQVVSSKTMYGSPAARTYTASGDSLKLALASGSLNIRTAVLSTMNT